MTDMITELRTWLERDAPTTEAALENAIAVYQGAAGAITALQAVQADAKLLLTEIMTETGETNVTTKAGKAYVTSASRFTTDGYREHSAAERRLGNLKLTWAPDDASRFTLIGQQGEESIWADEVADWIDTIPYEILCGIGSRVPRIYESA